MSINIFDILKPYDNDYLNGLSKKDLYLIKKYLLSYYLELRSSLHLNKNITFGLEVEVENTELWQLKDLFNKKYKNWEFKNDDTLFHGAEVVSPILTDNENNWDIVNNLLRDLSNYSSIESTCGGHIHIGSQIFNNNGLYFKRLYKLWCAFENIIFRFGYGEFISERGLIVYAFPLFSRSFDFNINYLKTNIRCNPLNYANVKNLDSKNIKGNTIEVRSPNGSLNPIIWQNNINFFVKLFEFVKSDKYDERKILKRIGILKNNMSVYSSNLDYYRLVDLDGALELADLIFDNNLDKVYFLRQYIKNEEVGFKDLGKGKKFTKNKNY